MPRLEDLSVGKVDFVVRHRLWSDEQKEAAERVASQIEQQELSTVRVSWGDQHGVVRGKTLTTHDFLIALRNGQDFQSAGAGGLRVRRRAGGRVVHHQARRPHASARAVWLAPRAAQGERGRPWLPVPDRAP